MAKNKLQFFANFFSKKICYCQFPSISLCFSLRPKRIGTINLANLSRTMLGATEGSEVLFEWDLQNIDISLSRVESPEFSFQGDLFFILLHIKQVNLTYGFSSNLSKPCLIQAKSTFVSLF